MKRVINIKADDGSTKLTLTASLDIASWRGQKDAADIVKKLKRELVTALTDLRTGTDFGVENIKIG